MLLNDADSIVESIAPQLQRGRCGGHLSNGGFDGIYEKLPERLRALSTRREAEMLPR